MIAHAFPPFFPIGFSIRVIKFIKYLPALGWLPIVLTISDKYEYENIYKVGSHTLLSEVNPQVRICRTNAGAPSLAYLEREREFSRRNLMTKAIVTVLGKARRWIIRNIFIPDPHIAWLPFALRRGRRIARTEEADVIFATCPPYSASLVGTGLKILTRKPLVLDFRDDWVGIPRYNSKPVIIRWIEKRMERFVVKMADKVISATEWSKNAFIARYPNEPDEKFVFISNGCDLADYLALDSRPDASRNSRFSIVHTGSLTDSQPWTRSPAMFFRAVHQLIRQQPELENDIELVFAGGFPKKFQRLADELGLSGVVKVLGHLPHDEVLRLTKSADLLLAIGTDGCYPMIPGKIYEYWAVGGPPILLLKCRGAAASFVEQQRLGFAVDPSDVAGMQKAIMTVYRRSKTADPMRISTEGIESFDRRVLARKLAQVLSIVSDGNL